MNPLFEKADNIITVRRQRDIDHDHAKSQYINTLTGACILYINASVKITDRLTSINTLVSTFPNDQELGYEVRKLINQWKDEDVRGSFK